VLSSTTQALNAKPIGLPLMVTTWLWEVNYEQLKTY